MTSTLSQPQFLKTLPQSVLPHLPKHLQGVQYTAWSWLIKFHFGEPPLHYEVSRVRGHGGWELGFHCEATDTNLNRLLLQGFRRHLFEIKDTLGEAVEAEMWDKGWTKIYEVYPPAPLTTSYRNEVGERLAKMIICLHPIFVEIRGSVTAVYR
jgi:hypothetical protein